MQRVNVTSAVELTSAQVKDLTAGLHKKLGKDIELAFQVDPSLLGGITITIGSRHFDGSVAFKLSQIKKTLHQNTN